MLPIRVKMSSKPRNFKRGSIMKAKLYKLGIYFQYVRNFVFIAGSNSFTNDALCTPWSMWQWSKDYAMKGLMSVHKWQGNCLLVKRLKKVMHYSGCCSILFCQVLHPHLIVCPWSEDVLAWEYFIEHEICGAPSRWWVSL